MTFRLYILLLALFTREVHAQSLASRPFIGHTAPTEIRGWCMFKKANSVTIHLRSDSDTVKREIKFYFDKERSYKKYWPLSFSFSGLKTGTRYLLSYSFVPGDLTKLTEAATQNDNPEDLTFLSGSCAFIGTGFNGIIKPGNDLRIFESMRRDSADMMLWLGDNLYYILQGHTYKKQLKRNVKTRLNEKLAAFLASKQQYAIWDDHDYGTNNSDGSFRHKTASLDIFRQFWPNPREGKAGANYFTFSRADVQFFMLDDRYENEQESVVLGNAQLQWLKDELLRSSATFKFICIGMQALNPRSTMECFYKTKTEYRELIDHIRENKIGGILFLSGDRHHAELMKIEEPGLYPLYDLTTSPLSMYPVSISTKSPEYDNPFRVPGTYFPSYNYSRIRISGPAGKRSCTLQICDREGRLVWTREIPSQLIDFQ